MKSYGQLYLQWVIGNDRFLFVDFEGYRIPGTCCCKEQLKQTRSWKVLSCRVWSWKASVQVGKYRATLESFVWTLIVSLKLESFAAISFQFRLIFPTSFDVSNFKSSFPTSHFFQPTLKISNFKNHFTTSARAFQLHSFQFHLELSN